MARNSDVIATLKIPLLKRMRRESYPHENDFPRVDLRDFASLS